MTLSCSHVLVWVADLHRAVRDYRHLGFQVDYATAEATAQHAHIWFSSGPIIELLTTPANAHWFKWPIELWAGRGAGRRMLRWPAEGERICDVAVVTERTDLRQDIDRLRSAGLSIGRPIQWRRTKPNGERISFQFAYPSNDRLPFLVTHYVPRQHPKSVQHSNGATRLQHVHMTVCRQDAQQLEPLVAGDPTFIVAPGERTYVRSIELAGLRKELDPALLHGAIIQPAHRPGPSSHDDVRSEAVDVSTVEEGLC